MGYSSNGYRSEIENLELTYENIIDIDDYGNKTFAEYSSVIEILSAIENDVNDALEQLNKIEGLTAINEITEKLKALSDNLY